MSLRGFLGRHYPIIVVAAVYLACLAILPLDGIWINDVGSRVIQVKSISASGYSDYSIDWPGIAVDPTFDYAPIGYPFAVVREGKIFSVYSPLLATLASPFDRIFGYPGLYLLPFAASIVMLLGLGRIAGEINLGERARSYAIFAAALSTPIWFYSLTFWEHTIAVSFCVWAVLCLLRFLRRGFRRDLAAAAALSAVATYFRPELYSFCLVLLVLVLWQAPARKVWSAAVFATTAALALVPLWVFQWTTTGQPFGLHLGTLVSSTAGVLEHIKSRPGMFFHMFVLSSPDLKSSILFSAPFLALFFVRPKLSPRVFRVALPLLGLLALVIFFLVYRSFHAAARAGSPISIFGRTNSLFPTATLLVLGLVRCRKSDPPGGRVRSPTDTLWQLAVIYALVYWLAAPEITKWGIHWGNRYLLCLYPLLAVLAAGNLADWQAHLGVRRRHLRVLARAAIASVVLASLAGQVWSVGILQRKMNYSARLNREVGARPEQVVVTSLWWVGQELYDQFQAKLIFLVRTDQQYSDLMRRLAERGYSRYLAVLPANEPIPSGWGRHAEVVRVSDNGLNYWDVNLVSLQVRSDRP